MTPADCARLTAAAEAMYAPGVLTPELPAEVAANWYLCDYLTGVDSVSGTQAFYGMVLKSKAAPSDGVVVIRGTENAAEWAEDAEFLTTYWQGCGSVEAGFFGVYQSLMFDGSPAATRLSQFFGHGARVTVTGHSLGAPVAAYLLMDLKRAPISAASYTGVFIASPKPGDSQFAATFDRVVGTDYCVYQNIRDVVTRVPFTLPPFLDYRPLSRVHWLKPGNTIPDNIVSNHSASNYALLLAGST